METKTNNNDIFKELIDNKTNIPEGIDDIEDSGFASIAGSIADNPTKDEADDTSIAHDVKFRTIDVNQITVGDNKRKRRIVDDEAKKKAEEEYNHQKREQTYKRLMHLLTKSKFYSSYIVDKINDVSGGKSTKKSNAPKKKKVVESTDENSAPSKRPNRIRRVNKKYDIRDYVSTDMKKKLDDQKKKMNLSEEDIEAELNSQSDSEDKENEGNDSSNFITPTYFKGVLRDYQIEGFKWLKVLYENGVNGILADEMGLGKTIQVIALFCHLLEKRQDGPYLIVAPLSTIPNWLSEFERFAPNLPVVLFHGTIEQREAAKKKIRAKNPITNTYSTYPIVITTYEVPLKEVFFLRRIKWRYIVIDEGQRIKNYKCQLLEALNQCESMNRLLLTGTPLQNNLSELWSLLNFLLPEIFDDLAVFESWFDAKELQQNEGTQKVLKQEEEKHVLSTLREILKPFMLRRLKSDVCLDIPPAKELIVYAPLTELQFDLYTAVLKHNLNVLSKIDQTSLILPEGSKRAKKRRIDGVNPSDFLNETDERSSRSPSPMDNGIDGDFNWQYHRAKKPIDDTSAVKYVEVWKKYADVNDRNRDFFLHLPFANRTIMYKHIVNHPYLMHCPLDSSGQPEINENMVKASGKLLVLDAMLKKLKARGHKVLLFSTMTMILDLIADYLTMRPWRFLMLDGRHDVDIRQTNIKAFNEDPDIFLFLISTRAGGVGLNLAGADTVIIYDSDWNPQCDLQAMARCHRIGQTRPVVVYRMCTKGTVDERIISRAQAKRKLEKMVISKDMKLDLKNSNTLTELRRLLETNETPIVTAEKEVYTEAELDKILDRSDLIWPAPKNNDDDENADSV